MYILSQNCITRKVRYKKEQKLLVLQLTWDHGKAPGEAQRHHRDDGRCGPCLVLITIYG